MKRIYTENELFWLYLSNTEGIYAYRLASLYFKYGDRQHFMQGVRQKEISYISTHTAEELSNGDWYKKAVRLTGYMAENNITMLQYSSGQYPENLKNIDNPPALLYCIGDISLLKTSAVAVIGSRSSTSYGRRCAERFSRILAQNGVTIASGMAEGIDGYSQRVAIACGGKTIAVLGNGVDYVYPESNRELYESICANGLVVSEFALNSRPHKGNFPYRNRLVIGLAQALLVIEAGIKSGTMSTVDFALEQGKSVYAVPGEIDSPTSEGTNFLIKNGAYCCCDETDILDEFGITVSKKAAAKEDYSSLEPTERKIMEALSLEAFSYEALIEKLSISGAELNVALINLEISGFVEKNPGRIYSKRRKI